MDIAAKKYGGKEAEKLQEKIEKLRKNMAEIKTREEFVYKKKIQLNLKMKWFGIALAVMFILVEFLLIFNIILTLCSMETEKKLGIAAQISELAATKTKLPPDGTAGNITINEVKN